MQIPYCQPPDLSQKLLQQSESTLHWLYQSVWHGAAGIGSFCVRVTITHDSDGVVTSGVGTGTGSSGTGSNDVYVAEKRNDFLIKFMKISKF